ncbi:MAG: pseudouridine synthase [Clostridia bacterium]
MRLQKFMAEAGVASRRKCEEYIESGLVRVNGVIASIGSSVEESDIVEFDGTILKRQEELVVIMLNKPMGVISSNGDPEGRRNTSEFFTELPYRLYNVGRLDYNSEGLLLFTNDGEFANKLMHPRYQIEKTYKALIEGDLLRSECEKLRAGVMLDDGMTLPATVEISYIKEGRTALYITIREGRNRQVRRMMDAVGHRTLRLRRVAIGKLRLSGLRAGEWRFLTHEEIELFMGKDYK